MADGDHDFSVCPRFEGTPDGPGAKCERCGMFYAEHPNVLSPWPTHDHPLT